MIALVNFTDDLVISRQEAEQLGLVYEECKRVGYSTYHNEKRKKAMSSYEKYVDECFVEEDEEGNKTYYSDESKKNKMSSYNLYRRAEEGDWVEVKKDNNMVNLLDFALKCKYPYSITKTLKPAEPTVQNVSLMFNEIEEKFKSISNTMDILHSQQFNQKVNVHVGGGLIVTYNELMLKENECTDNMQKELNDGWRIIAVCVQPDQRRPDYVLGRYNPALDVYRTQGAKR